MKVDAPEITAIIALPLIVERPTGEEVSVETAFPVLSNNAHAEESTDELPGTASPLPLIGILGLLSLGTAAGLRAATAAKSN